MVGRLFSINIAVKDLAKAALRYEQLLGTKPQVTPPEMYAFPGIDGVYFKHENVIISLMTSGSTGNPVGKFLEKRGEGVLLLSFQSKNIEQAADELRKEGVEFLMQKPAEGAFGRVNFIHPKQLHGVQVELIEPSGAL